MAKKSTEKFYRENPYTLFPADNGMKTVDAKTVKSNEINFSKFNSKTGDVMAFNLPVYYSCRHDCECYKNKICYACGGCYSFASNQVLYSENFRFFMEHTSGEFVDAVNDFIHSNSKLGLFRWFTTGDILNSRFFECMVTVARENPAVKFWTYTKKYHIVNAWIDANGIDALPENLAIIFSHWLNEDGTYFPIDNKYDMPTSEFIPLGREELAKNVTHICPCSDPNVATDCAHCDHACYTLKRGESMALLEHSTSRTKDRDAEIKAAHDAIKARA